MGSRATTRWLILLAGFGVSPAWSCAYAHESWDKYVGSAANQTNNRGPELALTMLRPGRDGRPVIIPGGTATVSIAVSNVRGDADAHASVLTVTLPDGLKLKQARPAPTNTQPANHGVNFSWSLGTIPARADLRIFELDITTAGDIRPNLELPVLAGVATSDKDADLENNRSVFIFRVTPAVSALVLESNLASIPVTPGQSTKFTVSVNNWGTISADGTELTLMLPPKISFQSSDPVPTAIRSNTLTWQLGDIPILGSRPIAISVLTDTSLVANVADTTADNLLKFTFDASTTSADAHLLNKHLEVEKQIELAGFDLQTWLAGDGTQASILSPGQDVTYAISYGNFGNATAPKTSISLSLGEGLSFVNADIPPAHSDKSDRFGGGVLTWDAGDLDVGTSKMIKCRVHVASVPYYGSLVMATATAAGTDINPANNSAFFYGYPAIDRGGGLSSALSNPTSGHTGGIWRWVILVLVLAGIIWVLRRRARSAPPAS